MSLKKYLIRHVFGTTASPAAIENKMIKVDVGDDGGSDRSQLIAKDDSGDEHLYITKDEVLSLGGGGGGIHTFPPPFTSGGNTIGASSPHYIKYTHCGNTATVTTMNVMQNGTQTRDISIQLGIYNLAKERLGFGEFTIPANETFPIPSHMREAVLDTPVELVAGVTYYFAILHVTPGQGAPTMNLTKLDNNGPLYSNYGFIGNSTASLPATETGTSITSMTPFYIGAY